MATIYIDNKPFEVDDAKNLLHVALSHGLDLPYFCWHPKLGSVGACRQCAVKQFRDEKDTRGKLVMACMTPAKDGTRISIEDPDARAFRASIIEWLMENHPHDCPVCDEGGECHLQDMTQMTGHNYRRYADEKRTWRNQDLGPFVNHEMNRCIQCYRCVRYYRDFADGRDFNAYALHNTVYFGRQKDGVLESEFSGNLVEVCPTGVFTDKTLGKHYVRKWDLSTAPSVCVNCSVGCNTIPGERYGILRRITARYNGQVNGYFLCDRGRYGYEFVNSEQRIRQPMVMEGAARDTTQGAVEMMAMPHDTFTGSPGGYADPAFARNPARALVLGAGTATAPAALVQAANLFKQARKIIGIGSPRASLQSNFALRQLVGPENFYAGVPEREAQLVARMVEILQKGPSRTPSLGEVENCDAVLVLGEDVTNYAPMLALALRQASRVKPQLEASAALKIPDWDSKPLREATQDARGPLFLITPTATRLEDIATTVQHAAPVQIAALGTAIARGLGALVAEIKGLSKEQTAFVDTVVAALKNSKRPLVVSGPGLGSEAIIQAAANIAWALNAQLAFTMPESNSFGLGLMERKSLDAAFEAGADTIIVVENDLYRRADAAAVDRLLSSAKHVIVLDHLVNPTTAKGEIVFPAATFAEGDGTLVNNEGRAQHFYQVFVPVGDIQESWRWLRDLAVAAGRAGALSWQNFDDSVAALAETFPVFQPVTAIAPPADFRIGGQKIARLPHRATAWTAMYAHLDVNEPKPPPDPDTPLAFSKEGYHWKAPPALTPRFWAPGWNSNQAVHKFQSEVGGPLAGGDPGKRLVEPAAGVTVAYFRELPDASRRDGELTLVPLYHIFGSEEFSVLTPGVAELTPLPYVALGSADAARLQLGEGDQAEVSFGTQTRRLPVRLVASLPEGVAGIPSGLPGTPTVGTMVGRVVKVQG